MPAAVVKAPRDLSQVSTPLRRLLGTCPGKDPYCWASLSGAMMPGMDKAI